MKALSLKLGLISVSIMLLPGVASAKGPGLDYVSLDGPGIGDPLQIEEHYPYLLNDAIGMHIFGSTTRANIARGGSNRAHLGPRFQLRYHMTFGEPIEIAFYPYADQAPVAYARSGQAAIVPVGRSREDVKFPLHPGWYDYRPTMVDLLQGEGLPTADEIDQGFPVTTVFILAGVSLVAALATSTRSPGAPRTARPPASDPSIATVRRSTFTLNDQRSTLDEAPARTPEA